MFKIEKITKLEVKPGETLVIEVEVGSISPTKSQEYLKSVKRSLLDLGILSETTKILLVAVRDGVPSVKFSIIKDN